MEMQEIQELTPVIQELTPVIQEITQEIQELTPVEITAETIPAIQRIILAIPEIPEIPEIPLLLQTFRRKRMESLRRSREPETMVILKRSPAPETTAILKKSPAPGKAESRKRILHRNNLRKRMLLGWWAKPR